MATYIMNSPGSNIILRQEPDYLFPGDVLVFNYTNDADLIWTVPMTGRYRIMAFGAAGQSRSTSSGGLGGKAGGDIFLTKDQQLVFRIYQRGIGGGLGGAGGVYSSSTGEDGGQGGGGTIVYIDDEVILAAGGGGGAGGSGNRPESGGIGGNGGDGGWPTGQKGSIGGSGYRNGSTQNGGAGGTPPAGGGKGGVGVGIDGDGKNGLDGPTVFDGGGGGGGGSAGGSFNYGSGGGGGAGGRSYISPLFSNVVDELGVNGDNGRIEITILELPYPRILVQDGTDIKTWKDNEWQIVGTPPVTKQMFDYHGLTAHRPFTPAMIGKLGSKSRILVLADPTSEPPKLRLIGIPQRRIVFANGDIDLTFAERVNKITLDAFQQNHGIVRVIVSIDSGKTWKAWDIEEGRWIDVDPSDLDNVKLKGMAPSTLNSLDADQWSQLIETPDKIRFAYYLELPSINSRAETDELTAIVDAKGSWDAALLGMDYTYGYPSNKLLRVNIFKDGNYKINWIEA